MSKTDHTPRFAAWLTAVSLTLLTVVPVLAQDAGPVMVEQLRNELAQRDAIIVELLGRVAALERSLGAAEPEAESTAATADTPPSTAVAATRARTRSRGDFEVDELAAERALERGLVREGARLLAPGQLELEPGFTLSRRNAMTPAALMSGDTSLVGEISRTYELLERRTNLRVGLPWASQLEIGLPYVTVDRKIATGVDGSIVSVVEDSGSGRGDAVISLSKVLTTEDGARPNLIGRVVWLSGNGDERDGDVVLGGGYSGYGARLSASWRRDPVVLLVNAGYTHYDDDPVLRPGDTLDVSFGLGLALSPETAMLLSLNQLFADEFERNGVRLRGTDRRSSNLEVAVSTTLGRRLFLRGYTTAGLTNESPEYNFGLSVTSRFDIR
jgi:hypothetical protein